MRYRKLNKIFYASLIFYDLEVKKKKKKYWFHENHKMSNVIVPCIYAM